MKLSFATLACPQWTIDQIAHNARQLGFDGVELRGLAGEQIGPDAPPAERQRVRAQFESVGVPLCSLAGYSCFTSDDPEQRALNVQTACKLIDLAQDLGCPRLRVFGGPLSARLDWDANLARIVAALARVAEHAERQRVQVMLETHDAWLTGEQVMAAVNGVGSAALGVCWDVANSFFAEPVDATFAAVRHRLCHVHFKDAAQVKGQVKSRLPGAGAVPLETVLRLLHAAGYREYLSFEWEKKWEPEIAEPEIALPHYLNYCAALFRKVGVPRG